MLRVLGCAERDQNCPLRFGHTAQVSDVHSLVPTIGAECPYQ
jgi:hypothetical protein